MAATDSAYFHNLPPLTSIEVAEIKSGSSLSLVLLEYMPTGGGVIFNVEYIHRELIYRTAGQKDAVALGKARIVNSSEPFNDVRILFSKPHKTATMRGLSLEGLVKYEHMKPSIHLP